MSLSSKATTFKDSKGHFHDDQYKADMASAQYILDAANPRGALSVQALVTLLSQNPEFYTLLKTEVDGKAPDANVDNTVEESGSQGGTPNAGPQPEHPNPSKKHSH